jgi:hypothetical protein
MRYSDFLLRYELIQEIRREEVKTQMIAASWGAWLQGAGGPDTTFDAFLVKYGLKEKPPPLTPEEKRKIADAAYTEAANIIKLDSKRRDRP